MSCYIAVMAGYFEQLAEWTEAVLSKHNIKTSRQAEVRAGISYSTIQNMRNGKRPSPQSLVTFATNFDEDPAEALIAAGYHDMAQARTGRETPERPTPRAEQAPELTYEPLSDDEEEVVSFYRGMPPTMRAGAKAALKAMLDSLPGPDDDLPTYGKRTKE